MANKSSAYVTAKAAGLQVDGYNAGQGKREIYGYIATAADEASASILRFVRVPSNARVSNLKLSAGTNAATTGQFDIGVYHATEKGAAVVNPTAEGKGSGGSAIDFFADALNLDDTGLDNGANDFDVTFHDGAYTIDKREMPLWEALGYTADPIEEFDIALTLTEIFASGPTAMGLKATYSI